MTADPLADDVRGFLTAVRDMLQGDPKHGPFIVLGTLDAVLDAAAPVALTSAASSLERRMAEDQGLPCGCTVAPNGWRTRAMSCNAHGSDGWSAYVGQPETPAPIPLPESADVPPAMARTYRERVEEVRAENRALMVERAAAAPEGGHKHLTVWSPSQRAYVCDECGERSPAGIGNSGPR